MKWMDVCYPPHIAAHWEDTMDDLNRYLRLSSEFGQAEEGEKLFCELENSLASIKQRFEKLVLSSKDPEEPESIQDIQALRPAGPRRLLSAIPADFSERLRGAFYGRMAGCT